MLHLGTALDHVLTMTTPAAKKQRTSSIEASVAPVAVPSYDEVAALIPVARAACKGDTSDAVMA
eukprot:SAG31_NODE_39164_length_290_cov_1.078534_1_plen_63_part_10